MARTYDLGEARNSRGLLPLAVISGLVAAVLVFVALVRSGDEARPGIRSDGSTLRVVIAQQNIPARAEIRPEMLSIIDVPGSLAVNGALESVEALIGESTRFPIAAGQQVTLEAVGALSDSNSVENVVGDGMRAMAVEVDETRGVGGLLLPGDRVDVIAVLTADLVGVDSAVTVLQGVEVIAVGQVTQEPLPVGEGGSAGSDATGRRPADAEPQPEARTVTLAVTPSQAQQLALIQENGKIWLSLRAFGDDGAVQLTESTLGVDAGQ